MSDTPIPRSIKLRPTEWDELNRIARKRGTNRHRLITEAARSIIQSQNPEAA